MNNILLASHGTEGARAAERMPARIRFRPRPEDFVYIDVAFLRDRIDVVP